MKLTFISTLQAYWGGSEVLWVRAANKAIQDGHKVQVVLYHQTFMHPQLQLLLQQCTSTILLKNDLPASTLAKKGVKALLSRFESNKYNQIDKFYPDCIIINQVHNYSAAFDSKLHAYLSTTSIPYYLLSQFNKDYNTLTDLDREKAKCTYSKARIAFFVSNRNMECTQHQLAQSLKKSFVLDNPLNITSPLYIKYPAGSTINFASVARLECNFKGQDILIKILSTSGWMQRDWHLNLYGTGPDESYLKDLCIFYGLETRVSFHGHVIDVSSIWEYNNILLLPSLAEGKPLALEEAMICGRTAVVSDVAGNTELIDDDTGYLASSFFEKPFAIAMELAWASKSKWEEWGKLCHERAITNLDLNPEKTMLDVIVSDFNSL